MHDASNIADARPMPDGGGLRQPVLLVDVDFDGLWNINNGRIGEATAAHDAQAFMGREIRGSRRCPARREIARSRAGV